MQISLKKSLYLGLGLIGAIGLAIGVITPIIISRSKHSSNDSVVIVTNKQYLDNEQQYLTNNYQIPVYTQTSKVSNNYTQDSIKNLYENAKNALNALNNINESSLNLNEKIWLDSYKTQWDIKIKNIENGLIYLGSNPISGSRILSSRENSVRNNIVDALNIYVINEETGDPDESQVDVSLLKTINNKIDDVIVYLESLLGFINDGMQIGIMPSNLIKKSFIKQTVQYFYSYEIYKSFNGSSVNEYSLIDMFNKMVTDSYMPNFFTTIFNKINNELSTHNIKNTELNEKISLLSHKLNEFMKFYVGEYYTSSYSYGGNKNPLKLSKTNNDNEVDQTMLIDVDGQSMNVYGLGYSQTDLDTTNIGIGFMTPNSSIKNIANQSYTGNNIYQQMLYNNNSISTSASEIYATGIDLTEQGTTKMKQIAQYVIKDILGYELNNFNPQIYYTASPFSVPPTLQNLATISSNGDYFTRFNIWLNQEDFFFGREQLINKESFIQQYWSNITDPELLKYKDIIVTQGYVSPWENKDHIDGSNATVSGNQALAGSVLSLKYYTEFKNSVNGLYASNFNNINDYVLSPYNYNIREDIGVGMEGPRASCQFQYNCDPYYSLQKWSVASLTTHEGAMGHHTQQEYWTEYMPGTKNGVVSNENATPGYSFVNDAFHEGWAVFTEWFAAELGVYGLWSNGINNGDIVPDVWTNNSSTILHIADNENDVTPEQIEYIKNYQGGVYYNIIENQVNSPSKYSTEASKAIAATKLANCLAYYGFLNESQLRNMRLALDTAVHYNSSSVISSKSLSFGASIQNERLYMQQNSGLGAGDINSESIRYMSIPSQATGYMLGKIIFNDLYSQVKSQYESKNSSNPEYKFINDKNAMKELFDLMLRNGEIPLEVLQETITNYYKF